MQVLSVLLYILISNNYHWNSADEFLSILPMAMNEAHCQIVEEEDSPHCIAYCESALSYLSVSEVNESMGICEDIIGAE